VAGLLLLISSCALAWGPATHCYIASCVVGEENPNVLLGAMLPDCNALILHNPAQATQLNRLTHREFDRLEPSAFATGFKTHNALWGADYYAHLFFDSNAEDIYSTVKIRQLSKEFGLEMSQAEDVFEMCVDIQLRMNMGPSLGVAIVNAGEADDMDHEQIMVDAFAAELASSVDGLSPEQAEQDIRAAVQVHKLLIVTFGEKLQLSEEEIHAAIPSLLKIYLRVDEETAVTYYRRGLEITADCMQELGRICEAIKPMLHQPSTK
jgi:hypothetical protein